MQHHTADADDRPRDFGQRQQRDHVDLKTLIYFGFGEAARSFATYYGGFLLYIQAITSLESELQKWYA